MSDEKPVCFISYSYDDIDRDTLGYLRYLLDLHSEEKYTILIDEELPYGANFDDFAELLSSEVDAVIIIMTPSYKQKIEERRGGTYEEYKRIVDRYYRAQKEKRRGKKSGEIPGYFELFPILYAGNFETAVPNDLKKLKFLDLRGLTVLKNRRGGFRISDYVSKKYMPGILEISRSLGVISVLKSRSYKSLYDSYFPRLFLELKADWNNLRDKDHNYKETLFVKTNAYRRVESQSVYFIIGRKGSGKTTIRDLLMLRQKDRFFGHVSIVADDFNLEALYSLFQPNQVQSDIRHIFSRINCFSFAWDAFLAQCCMQILVNVKDSTILNRYQKRSLSPLRNYLNQLGKEWFIQPLEYKNAYFVYCFNKIIEFTDDCISGARSENEYFYSDVVARFNRNRFLYFVFGEATWSAYLYLMDAIPKRVLLSLDGFDSAFDMFRRQSFVKGAELEERASFEIDWLRAFVQLVITMSQGDSIKPNPLHQKADYCITVPHDRFFEVATSERDSYRYQNRFQSLRWSGIELVILLRKRLEELVQYSTNKNNSPEARLEQVLKQHFPHIPIDISFMFNGKQYQMPLFLYVLRHTFWRPREILLYYANIIAVSEALRKKGKTIETEDIRRIVKDNTSEVIKTEFLNEFDSTLLNITQIIYLFTEKKQLISFGEIEQVLSKITFEFASVAMRLATTEEKIEFLYHIGFLGVYADKRMVSRLHLRTNHAFVFNEGEVPLRVIGSNGYKDYTFIIHPIFSEFLGLDTTSNELIMNYTWSYLHEMEAILFS